MRLPLGQEPFEERVENLLYLRASIRSTICTLKIHGKKSLSSVLRQIIIDIACTSCRDKVEEYLEVPSVNWYGVCINRAIKQGI